MAEVAKTRQNKPNLDHYDVVVVGARAAGAATAMLLANAGLQVLAVDRSAYGSDTLSTHALMRGAVSRLARWGLLEKLIEADTPVIIGTNFSYGREKIELPVRPRPGEPGLMAPRRTVLDPILVDGAIAAGAEVLHNTRVESLATDLEGRVCGVELALADGHNASVSADLVIGADGLRSSVARAVGAPITRSGAHASAYTVCYYRNLADARAVDAGVVNAGVVNAGVVDPGAFHWLYGPNRGAGVIPTNDGITCVFTGMPPDEFRADGRQDVAATHLANLERLDPELAAAVSAATPVGRIRSWPGVPGRFLKPHGPGWALVGDAGYFKDPYAAHGITDALRDAELLSDAVLSGDFDGYETRRDQLSTPLFDVLDRIASYDWSLEQLKVLHYDLSKAMRAEDKATIQDPVITQDPVAAGGDNTTVAMVLAA